MRVLLSSPALSSSFAVPTTGTSEGVSAAEAISKATNPFAMLDASLLLIAPGEEKLHYHHQAVHQKKRQSAATNALKRLAKMLVGVAPEVGERRLQILRDARFDRIVICALTPVGDEATVAEVNEFNSFVASLTHLAILSPLPLALFEARISSLLGKMDKQLDTIASSIEAEQLCALHWAISRLRLLHPPTSPSLPPPFSSSSSSSQIEKAFLALDLPFRVIQGGVTELLSIKEIKESVPFKKENLITRDGNRVQERRQTCWMAEEGIGGLAYSGKIMAPVPFSPIVTRIRDRIEEQTGIYYDCCLINLYEDAESACAYHSDPDLGTYWATDTCVVSVGETRRFNMRRIVPSGKSSSSGGEEEGKGLFAFHVFNGDIFEMFGNCQEEYQHAVLKGEGEQNNAPRASIVFKKALPRANGKKGLGVPTAAATATTKTTKTRVASRKAK